MIDSSFLVHGGLLATAVAGTALTVAGARHERRNRDLAASDAAAPPEDEIVMIDPDTGLPNDVGLLFALAEALPHARRLTLMWIGIDDDFGPLTAEVSTLLRRCLEEFLSPADFLARWDDTTYALLTPEYDLALATVVARDFRELAVLPQQIGGRWRCAAVSVGVVVCTPDESPEVWVMRAMDARDRAADGTGVAAWAADSVLVEVSA